MGHVFSLRVVYCSQYRCPTRDRKPFQFNVNYSFDFRMLHLQDFSHAYLYRYHTLHMGECGSAYPHQYSTLHYLEHFPVRVDASNVATLLHV